MTKKIYFLLLIALIGLNSVSASFQSFDAKSTKDPLYIQTPDRINEYIPINVKVYINDKETKEKANFVIIDPYNNLPYQTTWNPVTQGMMKYSGENSISFWFRPSELGKSGIDIRFIYAEIVKNSDSGNIHDENSEFYWYTNCNTENNKLLCNGQDSCKVCYKYISTINKDYISNNTINSIKFPVGMDEEVITAWDSYASYAREKNHSNGAGTYREYGKFTANILNEESSLINIIDEYKGSSYDDWEEEKIASPIWWESAFLFFKDQKIHNWGEGITLQYEIYSDMIPVGSGLLNAKWTLTTFLKDGEKENAIAKLKNDLLTTLGSFKLSPGSNFETKKNLQHRYSLYDREEIIEEEIKEEQIIFGSITDIDYNPLPYMWIEINIWDKFIIWVTDEIGWFSIPLEGIELKNEETDAIIISTFEYKRDDKTYFDLYFLRANWNYLQAEVGKKFKIQKWVDTEIRFKIEADPNDPSRTTNVGDTRDINPSGVIYYHMHEAIDFYLRKLKLNIDYKLPISVWIGNREWNTSYNSWNSDILIAGNDASNDSSDRPKNREYHEFSHHVMYDIYGARPSGNELPGMKNHGGFFNPGTADSYVEGFAEFMALVISDELWQDKPEIYGAFWSLEKNYRPWDGQWSLEEFAVASLLWDMYDNNNEDGDEIYYSIDTIWDVLKVERKDFYEYYKAFKEKKPKDADKIDKLFIKHGFFKDTRKWNEKIDSWEPWRRINEDAWTYEFIDLSNESSKLKYEEGLKIWPATNYERPDRSSTVVVNNSFVKINNQEVDFYTIKVSDSSDGQADYEYTVEIANEKVYIQPLPNNIEALITISPETKDYKTDSVYTIKNQELIQKLSNKDLNNWFIDEYKFDFEKTWLKEDQHYEMYENIPPSNEYKGDLDSEIKIKKGQKKYNNNNWFPFIKLILLILAIIYGYFYYKSEKVRKNTAIILKTTKKYLIISWKWFIEYIIPFLKKIWLLIWKYIKKLYFLIKEKYLKKKTSK